MSARRSVRGQAILAGMVFMLLLAAVTLVAIQGARDLEQRHGSLEHSATTATSLERAQSKFFQAKAALAAVVLSQDPAFVYAYLSATADAEQQLDLARQEALAVGDVDQAAALDDLAGQVRRLDGQVEPILPTVLGVSPEAGLELASTSFPELMPQVTAIRDGLEQLVRQQENEFAAEREAADRSLDITLVQLLAFAAVALVGGVAVIAVLVLSVVRPLASLQTSVKAIAAGDMAAEAQVSGPQEVASLAQDFNDMVAERRRADEALREAYQRYRTLFDRSLEAVYIHDLEGRFIDANDAALRLLGYTRDELSALSMSELLDESQARVAVAAVREILETGRQSSLTTFSLRRKDGDYVEVETAAAAMYEGGHPVAVQGIARDVTERRRAEEALRESEARFRDISENAVEWIWEVDTSGRYTYSSPAVEQILGYKPEEVLGKRFYALFHPEDREELKNAAFEAFAASQPFRELLNRNVHKNGQTVWLSTSGIPVVDEQGTLVGYRGADIDITERVHAEEALRRERDTAQRYLDIAGAMFISIDGDGRVSLVNKKGCEILGLQAHEIVGKNWFDTFVPEPSRDDGRAVFFRLMAGEVEGAEYFENPVLTASGQERVIAWHNTVLRDEAGQARGTLSSGEDITERKRAEEMIRAQRDLAVGLGAAQDLEETLRQGLESAIRLSHMDSGVIYLVDQPSGDLTLACHQGLTADFVKAASEHDGRSDHVRRIITGRPVYTRHQELGIPMNEARRQEDLQAVGIITAHHEGDIIACLCVASHTLDEVPVDFRSTLETVAAQVGGAIARRRAQDALRESEAKYRDIFENVQDIFYRTDAEGTIVELSPSVERYGYTREQLIGTPVLDLYERPAQRTELVKVMLERGEVSDYELRLKTGDGRVIDMSLGAHVVRGPDGTLIGFEGALRDITERKRMDESLRESEERYRDLFDSASDLVQSVKPDGSLIYVNRAWRETLGYSEEEVQGLSLFDVIHPGSREHCSELFQRAMAGETIDRIEAVFVSKDGRRIVVEGSANCAFRDGRPVATRGILRDVTARREAEEALQQSEAKYRSIFESVQDIYYRTDGQGTITEISPSVERWGYSREQMIGTQVLDVYEDPEERAALLSAVLERGELVDYGIHLKTGDGRVIDTSVNTHVLRGPDGEFAGVEGTLRDVSERKRIEEALRQSEQKYRSIFENVQDIFYRVDPAGIITEISPSVERCGYKRERLIGTPIVDLYENPDDRATLLEAVLEQGEVVDYEIRLKTADGRITYTSVSTHVVRGPDGEFAGVEGALRDINERKQAEEALLRQAERERELYRKQSEFVSTASHELRTPLHSIRGFTKLLLDGKVDDPETQHEFLTIVDEQSGQLTALVNDLLDVTRIEAGRMELQKEPLALHELVTRTITEFKTMAQEKAITIQTDLPPDLPYVEGDRGRLGQVLTNLVGNAIKFSDTEGTITIRASLEGVDLVVTVRDQGIGIPSEALPHLFDRFYQVDSSSTRPQGGTGLGLYISKQIVEAHGGRIWVDTKLGEGSTFSFAIPIGVSGSEEREAPKAA